MEGRQDRLARYPDNTLALELSLVTSLGDVAGDVSDPTLKTLFEGHRRITEQQAKALEARSRALGQEPSPAKGVPGKAAAWVGDMLHMPKDDYDKPTRYLAKAYTSEHTELGMYRALEAYAQAIGDHETVRPAQEHARQERETADKIRALIERTARAPAEAPEVAAASR